MSIRKTFPDTIYIVCVDKKCIFLSEFESSAFEEYRKNRCSYLQRQTFQTGTNSIVEQWNDEEKRWEFLEVV